MNNNLCNNNTTLNLVLKQHFKGTINKARLNLISLFIIALCKVKSVNYDKLASGFDSKVSKSSSYRRIQRFMAEFDLPMKLISTFIFNLLPVKNNLTLILDRTNWKFGTKNINILMLGVSYNDVAIPLIFSMLDKRGNSETKERIALIDKYIEWFGLSTIESLLADREFVGDKLLEYLNQNSINYKLRIRNNFNVYCFQKQSEIKAFWLFNNLKINHCCHYPRIVKLHGQLCYLSGCKTINSDGKLEFIIIVSFNKPQEALIHYKKRWQIESLFKSLKSSGFNIEDTYVKYY